MQRACPLKQVRLADLHLSIGSGLKQEFQHLELLLFLGRFA